MRIFLNGIGPFGADTMARLQRDRHQVVGVAAPATSRSGRPDRLFTAAETAGIPAIDVATISEPGTEALLNELTPDLGVMAFVERIVPTPILNLPPLGTIQYHPSLLPAHRGRSSVNWPIILGETVTGASIFWPDEGLDTGPLLIQREVAIAPNDTAGSLYRDKLYPLGIDLLAEAVGLIESGRAPKTPQDEAAATHDPPCQGRRARVDWSRPAGHISNLVRGCDPSPGAWTRFRDRRIQLFDPEVVRDLDLGPGVVGEVSNAGIEVGAGEGGAVRLRRLTVEGEQHDGIVALASALGITPGVAFDAGSA